MMIKDVNGNIIDGVTIKITEPPDPKCVIHVDCKQLMRSVQWYSHETGEGWIDCETSNHIFPNGTWDDLGYIVTDEFTNSYGLVFTYIKKKENIEQYCNFITSCLNNGNYDAIVSYEEWLETIRGYKPQ